MSVLVVLCTCPDAAVAEAIAATLVECRLAACVNMLPAVRSVYRWQGAIERVGEFLLLAKTTSERFDALRDCIVSIHPYSVPEVVALDVRAGLAPYLEWVRAETTPDESAA